MIVKTGGVGLIAHINLWGGGGKSEMPFYFLSLIMLFNSHTAAIAAGNNGIPVRMHGFEFGKASGMAPRAR